MNKKNYQNFVAPELKAVIQVLNDTISGQIGLTYDVVYENVEKIANTFGVPMGYLVQFIDIAGGIDIVLKTQDLTHQKRPYDVNESRLVVCVKQLVSEKMAFTKALELVGEVIHRTGGALNFHYSSLRKEGKIEQYRLLPPEEAEKDTRLLYEREKPPYRSLKVVESEQMKVIAQTEPDAYSEVAATVVPIRPQEEVSSPNDILDDLAQIAQGLHEAGEDVEAFFRGLRTMVEHAKSGKENKQRTMEFELENAQLKNQIESLTKQMKNLEEDSKIHREKVYSLEAEVYNYEKLTPVEKVMEMKGHKDRLKIILHPGGLVDVKSN